MSVFVHYRWNNQSVIIDGHKLSQERSVSPVAARDEAESPLDGDKRPVASLCRSPERPRGGAVAPQRWAAPVKTDTPAD